MKHRRNVSVPLVEKNPAAEDEQKKSIIASPSALGKIRRWTNDPQHRWKIIAIGAGVVVVGSGIGWLLTSSSAVEFEEQGSAPLVAAKEEKKPKWVPRLLDGVLVPPDQAQTWPVAVMIDNIAKSEVRPQWGLSAASLIYETWVEGSISRFMAIFSAGTSTQIGPIRSSRHYFLPWAKEWDAIYIHEGGSPEALAAIYKFEIRDLTASRRRASFWRDRGSYAPHNLFTSTDNMKAALTDFELLGKMPEAEPWKYKEDAKSEDRPLEARTLRVGFNSSAAYDAKFRYDQERNDYLRLLYDEPFLERTTDSEVRVKNVVVQIVPPPTYLSSGKGRIDLKVVGEGPVSVFRDGQRIDGTWKKLTDWRQTTFWDAQGNEMEFNRGPSWIIAVTADRPLEY